MIKRLHHVGVATSSIDDALTFYRDVLGLELAETLRMDDRQLKIAFLSAGDSEVELLEPTDSDTTVARFLERRGPGLHHICFRVEDVAESMREIGARGVEFVETEPEPGAVGLVCFMQPASANGVLIELSQPFGDTEG